MGGRENAPRAWMVIYSPDKLCPACPVLFKSLHERNASISIAGGTGAGAGAGCLQRLPALQSLQSLRHSLPRDQFFFVLGRVLRALFVLAPALDAVFRSRWGLSAESKEEGGVGGEREERRGVHSVGVQIRRGLWHVGSVSAKDGRGLLSEDGEAQV